MRRYLTLLAAIIVFAVIHEGAHAMAATAFHEYGAFHVRPFGLEVEFVTPVADRHGLAAGFGAPRYLWQLLLFLVFVVNRELIAQGLLPLYNVATEHPLFRPWLRLGPGAGVR
ncbi:MAG TPA: hypothetical protein VGL40_07920 [Bacillota bacterium]